MKGLLILASLSILPFAGDDKLASFVGLETAAQAQQVGEKQTKKFPELKSTVGRFAVTAPAPLKLETSPIATELGKLTLNQFVGGKGDTAYIVAYTDYPLRHVQNTPSDTLLENAVSGVVQELRGTITSEMNLAIDGNPGKEFSMNLTSNGQALTYRQRVFLVNNRLYQLVAVTPRRNANNSEINSFMKSFRLLK